MQTQNEDQDLDKNILQQMRKHFIPEAREHLDHLNLCLIQLKEDPQDEQIIEVVFRIFHTLKGSSAFAELDLFSEISKHVEKYLGSVRKGETQIRPAAVDLLYNGLDLLSEMIDAVEAGKDETFDDRGYLQKVKNIDLQSSVEKIEEESSALDTEENDLREIMEIYREGYDQLGALKHLIFASVHLSDPESLAVHLSEQIDKRMAPEKNSFWLVDENRNVVEIAKDGKLTERDNRRCLALSEHPVLQQVIVGQNTVWTSSNDEIKKLLPDFHSPVIFPIKSQPQALGFLLLDPEDRTEVELYQFISQFAAMIIRISSLHQKVEEQRKNLDEMTNILFRQNSQLSSLYHVELELMKSNNPKRMCDIVIDALVNDLEIERAAAFLLDPTLQSFQCVSGNNGFENIVGARFGVDDVEAFRICLEKGRIVSQTDFPEPLEIEGQTLENWIILGLKGWEGARGVMVVEIMDEDIEDSISIITNFLGIMLDNLALQEKAKKVDK